MSQSPLQTYRARVAAGELESDPAQSLAIEKLQLLDNRLESYEPPSRTDWFSYFTRKQGEVPKGLYLFGGVGRGKTMLMDIFYESVDFEPRRRAHFHAFMADVHQRISVARKTHDGDPLPIVGDHLAKEAALLCFDEFHVTDIADAMILGRLFERLFERNVIVVATSNVAPSGLYKDGLNRALFEPFIALLEDKVELLYLEARKDYRLDRIAGAPLYFSPVNEKSRVQMRASWERLTGAKQGKPGVITVKGRQLPVPEVAEGAAWFHYTDLFDPPLGPNDYLAIADAFHTVFIEGIPRLTPDKRDQARRMVTCIDALYDQHVRLIVSAECEPDEIYPAGDTAFLFERAASRLMEMRSEEYAAR
ncbi:MAG: cell division protein ZapE [Hyphomicrobiaceae bacterium]